MKNVNKFVGAFLISLLALYGTHSINAQVNEAVVFEGNDNNTSIESEHHNSSLNEKIDNPTANGEYLLADGLIKVTTDSNNKIANVEVLDSTKVMLTQVHIKGADAFNCYVSIDGLGSNGLVSPLKNNKIPEISHITVFYQKVDITEFVAPVDDHDTEIEHHVPVGENTTLEDGKIEVEFDDGYAIIKVLDKCINIDFVHGNEHYNADDSGYIKVPVDKVGEIIIYGHLDETCKPDETPDLEPQEPSKPEESKIPEFLPETGFDIAIYGLIGIGLTGTGIIINKKRK